MIEDRGTERMRKAEREVGENIPDEMVGLDSEDVGDLERPRAPGVVAGDEDIGEEADKSA